MLENGNLSTCSKINLEFEVSCQEQDSDSPSQLPNTEIAAIAFYDSIDTDDYGEIENPLISSYYHAAYHIGVVQLLCDLIDSSEFLSKNLEKSVIDSYKKARIEMQSDKLALFRETQFLVALNKRLMYKDFERFKLEAHTSTDVFHGIIQAAQEKALLYYNNQKIKRKNKRLQEKKSKPSYKRQMHKLKDHVYIAIFCSYFYYLHQI